MPRPSALWAPLAVVALALAACGGAPLRAAKRGPGRQVDVGPRPEGSADAAMPPPAPPAVKKLAAAEGHARAVLASGRVACWGDNGTGQAGAPPPYRPTPVAPAW